MLKVISINQLTSGMYVTRIVKQSKAIKISNVGRIKSEEMIEKMFSLGIEQVEIDTDRIDEESKIEESTATQAPHKDPREKPSRTEAQFKYDVDKSNLLYQEAKQIQSNLLSDIQQGKPIDTSQVKELTENFVDSIFTNSDALLLMTSMRDKDAYLFEHSVNVSIIMSVFAKFLNIDRDTIGELATGAFLHDIGKVLVPLEILNKPGKLTEKEYEIMKQHVMLGVSIASKSEGLSLTIKLLIKQHHERLNGLGYPDQLPAEKITRYGRMIAIVDVYDAITAKRCYKNDMLSTQALKILIEASGTDFDPELVQAFVKCIGVYSTGTLVMLTNGKLGFVLITNIQNPLKPIVRVFYSSKSKHYIEIKDIDLSAANCTESIQKTVKPEDFNINKKETFERVVLNHQN